MPRRPTLDDVARQAGVSGKTVSRVVNNEPHVSAAVKASVNAAILATGYQPNIAARTLASARSFLVGVLSPDVDSSHFHRLNGHLVRACQRRGRNVIVEQFDTDVETATLRLQALLGKFSFEGLILTQGLSDAPEFIACIEAHGINYVAIAPRLQFGQSKTVLIDEASGEIALAEHLWSLGHRQFAVFQAPVEARMTRGDVFIRRLHELGAAPQAIRVLTVDLSVPGLEAGRRAAMEILRSSALPSAIFAFTDEVAAGAVSFFLARRVQVPGSISVAGFDDAEIAQAVWPALTTVRQPIDTIAEMAATSLLDPILPSDQTEITCPADLIVRQSTAKYIASLPHDG